MKKLLPILIFLLILPIANAFCCKDPDTGMEKCYATGYCCLGYWSPDPCYGTLEGWVEDEFGNPIQNAVITATNETYNIQQETTTDSSGYYRFDNLDTIYFNLTASAIGYQSASQIIKIESAEINVANFTLKLICNYNGVCDENEIQLCPDCKTYVKIEPSIVYPGQKVSLTIYFEDARYFKGHDAKIEIYIDNELWNSEYCPINNENWAKIWKEWDGKCEEKNGKMHCEGEYKKESVTIKSEDGYGYISTTCKIPPNLLTGIYEIKVIPTIYSYAITLFPSKAKIEIMKEKVQPLQFDLLKILLQINKFLTDFLFRFGVKLV